MKWLAYWNGEYKISKGDQARKNPSLTEDELREAANDALDLNWGKWMVIIKVENEKHSSEYRQNHRKENQQWKINYLV